MNTMAVRSRISRQTSVGCSCLLGWVLFAGSQARVHAAEAPMSPPASLSLDAAVLWAFQNNPELIAIRQQHGVAAAGIVIADTYPFNPIMENKVRGANGPESAGITNRVAVESKILVDVEVRGQGRYRRQGAGAALSRADAEIATLEAGVSVRVIRAFDAFVYRRAKLRLAERTLEVTTEAAEQVRKLVDGARLRPADLILARTEIDDVRAQLSPARAAAAMAEQDLRRALGVLGSTFEVQGDLEPPLLDREASDLLEEAQRRRQDLRSREAAVEEADARLKLEKANRFGNPNVGPAYEYDPTRVNLIGAQFTLPLPLFNTHKGEIMQREAELARAMLDLRQAHVQIAQDVQAALARWEAAHAWAATYRDQVLPSLRTSVQGIEKLFEQGDPGVDVLRVIDTRRKELRARDGYLDALWEVRQARADLAAAVGDPALVIPALRSHTPSPAVPVRP